MVSAGKSLMRAAVKRETKRTKAATTKTRGITKAGRYLEASLGERWASVREPDDHRDRNDKCEDWFIEPTGKCAKGSAISR